VCPHGSVRSPFYFWTSYEVSVSSCESSHFYGTQRHVWSDSARLQPKHTLLVLFLTAPTGQHMVPTVHRGRR
jgi:hypothetical protein